MKLIIGLGNPGEKYQKTRHNLGWWAVDCLAKEIGIKDFKKEKKFNALVAISKFNGQKIVLAKPLSFMNNSGQSVEAISSYFKIAPGNIIVVHDEIDLPLGETKLQEKINSAGHKGVQSVIDHLKTTEFKRVRLGIKSGQETVQKAEDFVLDKFSQDEENIIEQEIEKAIQLIILALSRK